MASQTETEAMRRALALAADVDLSLDPNPRVGAVVLSGAGAIVGEGAHRGAGTAHAEAVALDVAGPQARGATIVVTLEPCNHARPAGPCSQAVIDAGVRRVVFAQADPNPEAAGGGGALRRAGVDVEAGLLEAAAHQLNAHWAFAMRLGRPFVTWKLATTLDGRSAAADGTSAWITGSAARRDVHRLRAECDTVLVGTGTVAADNPHLTVRSDDDVLCAGQPRRAVMGLRDIPVQSAVLDDAAETCRLVTRDPQAALTELFGLGSRHVWLEGGPTLAAAFLRDGLVDEIVAYVAPAFLGAGRSAVADLGIATIADAVRLDLTDVTQVGSDVRLTMRGPH